MAWIVGEIYVKPFRLFLHRKKTSKDPRDIVTEPKYIVYETELLRLFETCPICGEPTSGEIDQRVNTGWGSMVRIVQNCVNCEHSRTWNSQPMRGNLPLGNLMLSAAIIYSGSKVSQVLRLAKIFSLKMFSRETFHRHQNSYLIPSIITGWKVEQATLLEELRQLPGGLQLAGDCRNDSPGHSAKYGTYTLIEQTTKKVIEMQVVQVNT